MTYNESSFQTAIKMLIPPEYHMSEVQLVINRSKKKGDGKFQLSYYHLNRNQKKNTRN